MLDAQRDKDAIAARLASLSRDVESVQALHRSAQSAYERQVLEHGDTVRKLNAVEASVEAMEARVAQAQEDAQAARDAQVRAIVLQWHWHHHWGVENSLAVLWHISVCWK